jgi:hypothetical protein
VWLGKLFNSLCPSSVSLVIRGFKLGGGEVDGRKEGITYINNVRNSSKFQSEKLRGRGGLRHLRIDAG